MNATQQEKGEKLFSLVVSGETDFVIFSFIMTENPSNYGYKRIPSIGCGDQCHFIYKINNLSVHVIFSNVRKISINNTFLSVYCHISFYNSSLSTLECSRTLKTFWFTNTRRQDYVHCSIVLLKQWATGMWNIKLLQMDTTSTLSNGTEEPRGLTIAP
jgi:hypothetical protein